MATLDDVIGKLKAVEGLELSDEEINLIQGVKKTEDTKSLQALTEAKATSARILEEKKLAVAKQKKLEEELEALKNKDLSESEKIAKDMEKLANENLKAKEEYNALQNTLSQTVKQYNLEKIGNSISFMDNIPKELQSIAIEKIFGEVDVSDADAMKNATEAFTTQYASILASSDTAKGTGSTATNVKQTQKSIQDMNIDERAKMLLKR